MDSLRCCGVSRVFFLPFALLALGGNGFPFFSMQSSRAFGIIFSCPEDPRVPNKSSAQDRDGILSEVPKSFTVLSRRNANTLFLLLVTFSSLSPLDGCFSEFAVEKTVSADRSSRKLLSVCSSSLISSADGRVNAVGMMDVRASFTSNRKAGRSIVKARQSIY